MTARAVPRRVASAAAARGDGEHAGASLSSAGRAGPARSSPPRWGEPPGGARCDGLSLSPCAVPESKGFISDGGPGPVAQLFVRDRQELRTLWRVRENESPEAAFAAPAEPASERLLRVAGGRPCSPERWGAPWKDHWDRRGVSVSLSGGGRREEARGRGSGEASARWFLRRQGYNRGRMAVSSVRPIHARRAGGALTRGGLRLPFDLSGLGEPPACRRREQAPSPWKAPTAEAFPTFGLGKVGDWFERKFQGREGGGGQRPAPARRRAPEVANSPPRPAPAEKHRFRPHFCLSPAGGSADPHTTTTHAFLSPSRVRRGVARPATTHGRAAVGSEAPPLH